MEGRTVAGLFLSILLPLSTVAGAPAQMPCALLQNNQQLPIDLNTHLANELLAARGRAPSNPGVNGGTASTSPNPAHTTSANRPRLVGYYRQPSDTSITYPASQCLYLYASGGNTSAIHISGVNGGPEVTVSGVPFPPLAAANAEAMSIAGMADLRAFSVIQTASSTTARWGRR